MDGEAAALWKCLCEEITKLLTAKYEMFKPGSSFDAADDSE